MNNLTLKDTASLELSIPDDYNEVIAELTNTTLSDKDVEAMQTQSEKFTQDKMTEYKGLDVLTCSSPELKKRIANHSKS